MRVSVHALIAVLMAPSLTLAEPISESGNRAGSSYQHTAGTMAWRLSPRGGGVDDSDNLQRALTEATQGPDSGEGAEIRLAAGTFWVRTMLIASAFRGTIRGAGNGTTRIMAGTSQGGPMDLPTREAALKANIVRLPNLFQFYEEAGSHVGTDVTFRDLALETVDAPGLPEGAPNPIIYWGFPYWNRNIVAFISVAGVRQASYPIFYQDYLNGAKARVGRASIHVDHVDLIGHLSPVPYESHYGQRIANVDLAIDYEDWASSIQFLESYDRPLDLFGMLQVPGDPAYYFYQGPEIPRSGSITIEHSTIREVGLVLYTKQLSSKPAQARTRFYDFDGPAGLHPAEVRFSNNRVERAGYSPAGGAWASIFLLGYPAAVTTIQNNVFSSVGGGVEIWLDEEEDGLSRGLGVPGVDPTTNWSLDTSMNPLPTLTVAGNVIDVTPDGIGPFEIRNWADGGHLAIPFNFQSGLITENSFIGMGSFNGSMYVTPQPLTQLGLEDVINFKVTDNVFSEPFDTPAISLTSIAGAKCRKNIFAGVAQRRGVCASR